METNCNECPCLNIDNEEGATCNLGYITEPKKSNTGCYRQLSPNCGLIEIRTKTYTLLARSEKDGQRSVVKTFPQGKMGSSPDEIPVMAIS